MPGAQTWKRHAKAIEGVETSPVPNLDPGRVLAVGASPTHQRPQARELERTSVRGRQVEGTWICGLALCLVARGWQPAWQMGDTPTTDQRLGYSPRMPPSPTDARFALLIVFAATYLSACATIPANKPQPSEAANGVAVSGPRLGDHRIEPTQCTSGGRYLFLGADLIDERAGLILRLVVDPVRGNVVRVFDPKNDDTRSLILSRASCATFDTHLEFGGSMVNGVREMKVSIALDCHTPSGDIVVGKAASESCL